MTTPSRILLIRPSALGDVCRSTPALVSLKRAYPDASIDWLVQDSFSDAVRAHPDLNAMIPFDRRAQGKAWTRLNPRPSLRFLGDLRRAEYDLVIDAQGLIRSGLFSLATGAARRLADRNAREQGWRFGTERHAIDPDLHAVDRMLALLEAGGVEPVRDLRLHTPPDAERHGLGDGPYVVLAPTSRWSAKQWPDDRFRALGEALLEHGAERVVVVGGPSEQAQCPETVRWTEREPRAVSLIGKTSVGGLMGVIEGASLLIANDSAAVHMGVGFDRPLVALYGPTRVELVGPYGRAQDVIQHTNPGDHFNHKNPAGAELMDRITTEEVVEAALARLNRS